MPMSVEEICKTYVKDASKVANCNVFVQAVAEKVASEWGVDLKDAFSGNADLIRSRFGTTTANPPFHCIGRFPNRATELANEGQFVVGGLTHQEMTYIGRDKKKRTATMGHVVVIAPGGPSKGPKVILADGTETDVRGGYPYCYQGAAHEIYRIHGRTQVDLVFPAMLLKDVVYAYIEIQKKKAT